MAGTPEQVAQEPRSYTGQFLKPYLKKSESGIPNPESGKRGSGAASDLTVPDPPGFRSR